jgi:hypothetical protein
VSFGRLAFGGNGYPFVILAILKLTRITLAERAHKFRELVLLAEEPLFEKGKDLVDENLL